MHDQIGNRISVYCLRLRDQILVMAQRWEVGLLLGAVSHGHLNGTVAIYHCLRKLYPLSVISLFILGHQMDDNNWVWVFAWFPL